MADIYKVNSDKIVGGPGRLIVKAWDGSYPESIEDVINLNTYDLIGSYRDLGATSEGITISRGFETEDFNVDQMSAPVDTDITGWTHALSTILAENTPENRQIALAGDTIIETAPTLGTSTTTTTQTAIGGTILNVTSVAGFSAGGYLQLNGTAYRIAAVSGNTVTLERQVTELVASGASVTPITELGTRRIGYGTVSVVPFYTYVLISKKKDETLYMAVFRKCKISGDETEQTFGTGKRLLPMASNCYPDGNLGEGDNVYYEIEQMV